MAAKSLVIYKSKTGFTERYARWIAEELGCDAVAYAKIGSVRLADYNRLIYGGGFYAGRINGLADFLKRTDGLALQRIVFATGATPPEAPEVQTAMRQNFTDEQWRNIPSFYMHSGLCYERMGIVSRMMMAAFCKMMTKKEGDTEATRMIRTSFDAASWENIKPLVALCQK